MMKTKRMRLALVWLGLWLTPAAWLRSGNDYRLEMMVPVWRFQIDPVTGGGVASFGFLGSSGGFMALGREVLPAGVVPKGSERSDWIETEKIAAIQRRAGKAPVPFGFGPEQIAWKDKHWSRVRILNDQDNKNGGECATAPRFPKTKSL